MRHFLRLQTCLLQRGNELKKPSSVSISKLARYASDPTDIFKKVDQQAVRYGNRAHGRIGKGPSLILYVLIALALVALAAWKGLI